MAERRIPIWLRTLLATMAGVVIFLILALVWNLVMAVPMLFILGVGSHTDPLKAVLVQTVLVIIPYGGFVIAARFLAARLSNGKASLPTTLLAGGLTALAAAYMLVYWFLMQ